MNPRKPSLRLLRTSRSRRLARALRVFGRMKGAVLAVLPGARRIRAANDPKG